MTTPKNRTSARQAAARQRIAQRDSPAGSDPPDERTNEKWTINPDKSAEKEILISMVAYLRDDPTINDDLNVLRFICRDWYTLERTLHTKATIDTIKRRLIALGIRYIHRTPDLQWQYWNDYTPLAMMNFYPAQEERLETPKASPDRMTVAPASVPMARTSGLTHSDRTEHTGQEGIPLETMPTATPRHSTSQSGAANLHISRCTTDTSSSADDTNSTEDEVVYLGTQKPVTDDVDDSDTSAGAEKHDTTVKKPYHTETPDASDEEGFTRVVTRQT
jgi:hypothetical protein